MKHQTFYLSRLQKPLKQLKLWSCTLKGSLSPRVFIYYSLVGRVTPPLNTFCPSFPHPAWLSACGSPWQPLSTSQMSSTMPPSQEMLPDDALPGTPFPGFLLLWAPRERAPEPRCLTPGFFRKPSDPGSLRVYSRLLQAGHQNPAPSTSSWRSFPQDATSSTRGDSSSGKATSATSSRCQNCEKEFSFPFSLVLLYVSPFLSSSSTDTLSLKSHCIALAFFISRLQI